MRKVDETKRVERREQILSAALRCFERDGFRGASIASICAEAGMSPGHLYHYFDSKDAIVKAIVETRLQSSSAAFAEIAEEPDMIDAMKRFVSRTTSEGMKSSSRLGLEIAAEATRSPTVGRIMGEYYASFSSMLAGLLRKGQELGQIDPKVDPRLAAAIMIAVRDGVRHRLVLDPHFSASQANDVMRAILDGYRQRNATSDTPTHPRQRHRARAAIN